jgi:hypothetical protein
MDAEAKRRLDRLLRAMSFPGHGVLVRTSGELLVETGDPEICRALVRIALLGTSPIEATTEWLSDGLVACGQQRCGLALVVAMPESFSMLRVHHRIANALGMFASLTPSPRSSDGSPPSGGTSGAPAEVSITAARNRQVH